ncbi:sigma-E processing peptidase SpoIIGA [Candidatus Arthromitus sp. SFB-rat-Yit]|uniref:sigma-E processing peptidase SpoIIGA n=1 Tax=Candidatus Arthromitus sp. SFB-rat-Yit TaxID=1041504 RepID=UPI000227A0D9|nr:sigma-E processing peptidase SpoIIGA [Candidatus Arthromitus sp. SFB-rat-Yit]BAK81248.1 sporulation factor SpoIIGA [Candidatus Arthromitus sp. SFB-rat-Yit]
MIIYYDLFIFENFIFNLFILYTSFKILNLKLNFYRLLFASIVSSFISSLILINLNSVIYLLFIILTSTFAGLILCVPEIRVNYFIQIIVSMFFTSFILFGIIKFLSTWFVNINYKIIFVIFIVVFVIYGIVKKYITRNTFFNNYIFEIELNYQNKIYKFNGFLDTGNELYEPVSGLPVIIVEKRCIPGIFYHEKYFYKIPYKVITGDVSYFEGIKVKNVHFKNNNKDFYADIILCTTYTSLDPNKRFEAILSRCII